MSKFVIASGLLPATVEKLNAMGIGIITFHDNESVGVNVRNHADLSFLDCNDGTVFIASEMYEYKEIIR